MSDDIRSIERPSTKLLKAPLGPPDPPAGSRGSVETFRASKRLLTLRLLSTGGLALLLLPLLAVVMAVVAPLRTLPQRRSAPWP